MCVAHSGGSSPHTALGSTGTSWNARHTPDMQSPFSVQVSPTAPAPPMPRHSAGVPVVAIVPTDDMLTPDVIVPPVMLSVPSLPPDPSPSAALPSSAGHPASAMAAQKPNPKP